jgi:hypothetical protein
VFFSFCRFFSVSYHIHVLLCEFIIFFVCSCSCHIPGSTDVCASFTTFFLYSLHNPGPTVCIFHISGFSIFLTVFQFLKCVFLTLHVFQCFFPYFMSYHVSFSWFSFVSFLILYQVLQSEFLLFQVGQFSRHIPGPTVCISHFSGFSVFLAIFHVLPCEFISFLICQFSCHIPGLKM